MTDRTESLVKRAESTALSALGIPFDGRVLREKIESGLEVDDVMYRGSQRLVWLGAGKARRERRGSDGEWTEAGTLDVDQDNADEILMAVAIQQARDAE